MPKFETLEEAQKWADENEGKIGEAATAAKKIAELNRENAERRKREKELEGENAKLKESAMSDAEKKVREEVLGELKGDFDDAKGKLQKELDEAKAINRRLALEGAAVKAGADPKKVDRVVKLLPEEVDPTKAEEVEKAVRGLIEEIPGLGAAEASAGGSSAPPASRGGGEAFRLEDGKAVSLEDLNKNFGTLVQNASKKQ